MPRRYRHVELNINDPAATAAEYDLQASRDYGRARTEARRSADWYKIAGQQRRQAAWLTARPDMWTEDYTPAGVEAAARSYERLGDSFLRAHFHATDLARFHRGLARDYRAMAGRARLVSA